MAAKDNIISGDDYILYAKAITDPASAYKMVMCQTDFSLTQSKNVTESQTKCGRRTSSEDPIFEASLSGSLVNTQAGGGQDYIDMYGLQDYFVANQSYSFMLMPKLLTAQSNGKPTIEFTANPSAFNHAYPTEGDATFELTLPLDDAPTIEPYTFATT